jgi:hypothetical protein
MSGLPPGGLTVKTEQMIFEIIKILALCWVGYWAFVANRKVEWVKTELSKEVFAHSVKFKNEFEVYKYLWEKAAHFARAVKAFASHSWSSDKPSPTEMLAIMGPILREKHEVEETLLNNAAFISDDVKGKAERLVAVAYPPEISEGHQRKIEESLQELKIAIRKQTGGAENGSVRQNNDQ